MFTCSLVAIIFLAATPCKAGGNRQHGNHHDGRNHNGYVHHHHDHSYRWFGVIPRPNWAAPYYYVPQYDYVVPAPYPVPPPPHFSIDAPAVKGVPREPETIIIVPQERQSFEDYQKPINIPIPEISVSELQASVPKQVVPQPPTPRSVTPKRIDPSKAVTVEKHVTGEASCPLDLPKGGIVRVCNAHSGKYKISQEGNEKYFHQQQCWLCENILGGDYVRWQEQKK